MRDTQSNWLLREEAHGSEEGAEHHEAVLGEEVHEQCFFVVVKFAVGGILDEPGAKHAGEQDE